MASFLCNRKWRPFPLLFTGEVGHFHSNQNWFWRRSWRVLLRSLITVCVTCLADSTMDSHSNTTTTWTGTLEAGGPGERSFTWTPKVFTRSDLWAAARLSVTASLCVSLVLFWLPDLVAYGCESKVPTLPPCHLFSTHPGERAALRGRAFSPAGRLHFPFDLNLFSFSFLKTALWLLKTAMNIRCDERVTLFVRLKIYQ